MFTTYVGAVSLAIIGALQSGRTKFAGGRAERNGDSVVSRQWLGRESAQFICQYCRDGI